MCPTAPNNPGIGFGAHKFRFIIKRIFAGCKKSILSRSFPVNVSSEILIFRNIFCIYVSQSNIFNVLLFNKSSVFFSLTLCDSSVRPLVVSNSRQYVKIAYAQVFTVSLSYVLLY